MPAPYSTLQNIYTKVRRLVRATSANQLSDNEINNYVNTFLLYDLPEALRLFNLRKTFTFYTTPYVDSYPLGSTTETVDETNPFYNFKNRYLTIHEPLYIAGFKRFFTQSRDQFYGLYPQVQSINALPSLGDGVITNFTGTLPITSPVSPAVATVPNQCIVRNFVVFNSIDANNNGIVMHDVPLINAPTFPTYGNLAVPNAAPTSLVAQDPVNYVNYVTGAFSVTFPVAPAAGKQIFTQCVPTVCALPQAMLEFDDTLVLRPVPDQVYQVSFEVYVQPTELLSTNLAQEPELQQWAQYIAYGASRKVFQDRMDLESVQLIEPEFKAQERFVMRRTIVQLTNQRVATLFTEGNANWPYGGFGYFGNNQ